jgi:glucose/arabinose dehydrogenase
VLPAPAHANQAVRRFGANSKRQTGGAHAMRCPLAITSNRVRFIALFVITAAIVLGFSERARQQAPLSGPGARREYGPVTATTIADGLNHPWSVAFLPDGSMLVTEIVGRVRVIRHGVLDPNPVVGVPKVHVGLLTGLMDVALHPDFANNHYVYLTYTKAGPPPHPGWVPMGPRLETGYSPPGVRLPTTPTMTSTLAVARGVWDGNALTDVREIFIADDWKDDTVPPTMAARMVFGRDGMLYITAGGANAPASAGPYYRTEGGVAQDPARDGGKVLRLRDDGTIPKDNPFVGRRGYKPEIYTMGHRNAIGLAVHPRTGAIWLHENGPQDGDEVNILKPGANYGWPAVGMGRDYSGDFIGSPAVAGKTAGRKDAWKMYMEGMEQPFIFWTPTVAPSGMAFYTADKFPDWKGSLLIGELKAERIERIVFNDSGGVIRREYLLEPMKQRIRDVRQGPDGLVYVLTDANPGALLKLEPTQ